MKAFGKLLLTTSMIAASHTSFVSQASASSFSRVVLGHTSLMDRTDVDIIRVGLCLPGTSNKFIRKIKLNVHKYPAQIDRLVVSFANGGQQTLYVRKHFARGSGSRWMDLHGGLRCVKKIKLIGDTDTIFNRPFAQAKVWFYGKK